MPNSVVAVAARAHNRLDVPCPVPVRRPPRTLVAVLVGLVVCALLLWLAAAGSMRGIPAATLAACLSLAVPTSRVLSRRILLAGAFFFGLTPILWWARLPLGTVGRSGFAIALIGGGLATWLLAGGTGSVRERALTLLPRLALVDAIPPMAAAVSAWVAWRWLAVRSDAEALGALLPGWDNSAHFNMANLIGVHGVTVDLLGAAPGGEAWQYDDYPQGYHAVVATVMELFGSRSGEPVAAFVRAEALVLVLLAGLLAAAVCSLPRLRRRPEYALPLAVLLVAAFVVGPGGTATTAGFPNYVVACGLAACVPLLVAAMPRVATPWHVAALGALLVGVANSWLILMAAAVPAALPLLLSPGRARWRASRSAWIATNLALVVAMAAAIAPLRLLTGLDAGTVLTTGGAFAQPDFGLLILLTLGAAALCLLGGGRRGAARAWHALGPLTALLACAALAAWQLRSAGQLSYYAFKLMRGTELVALATVVLALSWHVRPRPSVTAPSMARRLVAVALATVAATQATGYTATARGAFAISDANVGAGATLLTAAAVPVEAGRVTLVAPGLIAHELNAQQWYLALTGRWTRQANSEATVALVQDPSAEGVVPLLLAQRDDAVVVVAPASLAAARAAAGRDAARVVSW